MGKKTSKALAAQEAQITQLSTALEESYSTFTLLQRQVEDLQYIDLSGPALHSGNNEILPTAKQPGAVLRLRRMRHENPIAKQSIKLALRFVLGKGINYLVQDTTIRTIIDEFWDDPVNSTVLTSHQAMKRRFDETLTDGEIFLVMFASEESPYVRLGTLPIDEVVDILYDPDNNEVPVWYKRKHMRRTFDAKSNNNQGMWTTDPNPIVKYYRDYMITDERLADIESRGLRVPQGMQAEGVVKHRMINEVRMRGGLRGVSELYSSREWFRVFKEFMEDRGAINAAANALSYQRKIKGGPTAVRSLSGRIGGVKVSAGPDDPLLQPDAFLRPIGPGSTIDTNENVDWKNIRADTGAPGAVLDARMMLAAGTAGVGTSLNYYGETSGSLASAHAMELPMVKGYEEWQSFVRNELQEICEFVISVALGRDADNEEKQIAWEFPPIITQDVVKWITAFAQFAQQIAPGNRAVKEIAIRGGLNTLQVANPEAAMDEVRIEEDRLQKEKELLQQAQLDAMQQAGANPNAPPVAAGANLPPNGNGNGKGNGQKVGGGPQLSAFSPDMHRMVGGRPPKEPTTGPQGRRK